MRKVREGAEGGAGDLSFGLTGLPEQAWKATPARFLQGFKQFLCFAELFHYAIDNLDICPGTASDAPAPAGIQYVRVASFDGGH